MKDAKFIELLNLYVDHQINPAESALLESEVRSSPDRRRIYREYCEMQKGCAELAESFRAEASATETKIDEFKPRRRAMGAMTYMSGFVAVAACAAVLIGLRSHSNEPVTISPSAPQVQIAAVAMQSPAVVPTLAPRQSLQPAFGPHVLTLLDQASEPAEVATADQTAFGEWMNSVRLSSLPGANVNDFRFDAQATLPPDGRSYHSDRPIQGKVELTAFTFQK
ncbi:MAG: hypothetical protein ABI222_02545 [Opitutaceae bacterium]